jgi:hypothetical protein
MEFAEVCASCEKIHPDVQETTGTTPAEDRVADASIRLLIKPPLRPQVAPTLQALKPERAVQSRAKKPLNGRAPDVNKKGHDQ